MAADHGLPSVPRGLERGLTQYLQSLDAMVRRIAGVVRGSDASRAVRASEAHTAFGGGGAAASVDIGSLAAQVLRDGSVTERKIADNAISERKLGENTVTRKAIAPGEVITNALAEGCVSTGKLASASVTASRIAPGSITRDKLAAGCVDTRSIADASVTAIKLAPGVLPDRLVCVAGEARDGETVYIPGKWLERPVLFLTNFEAAVQNRQWNDGSVTPVVTAGIADLRVAAAVKVSGAASETWIFESVGNLQWVALCKVPV